MTTPEPASYGLVMPFIVCKSEGGPYDDEAFAVGYQAGWIDKDLAAAKAAGADRLRTTVPTPLLPQLELIAMQHGFPSITAEPWDEHPDEWTFVTFSAGDAAEADQP